MKLLTVPSKGAIGARLVGTWPFDEAGTESAITRVARPTAYPRRVSRIGVNMFLPSKDSWRWAGATAPDCPYRRGFPFIPRRNRFQTIGTENGIAQTEGRRMTRRRGWPAPVVVGPGLRRSARRVENYIPGFPA